MVSNDVSGNCKFGLSISFQFTPEFQAHVFQKSKRLVLTVNFNDIDIHPLSYYIDNSNIVNKDEAYFATYSVCSRDKSFIVESIVNSRLVVTCDNQVSKLYPNMNSNISGDSNDETTSKLSLEDIGWCSYRNSTNNYYSASGFVSCLGIRLYEFTGVCKPVVTNVPVLMSSLEPTIASLKSVPAEEKLNYALLERPVPLTLKEPYQSLVSDEQEMSQSGRENQSAPEACPNSECSIFDSDNDSPLDNASATALDCASDTSNDSGGDFDCEINLFVQSISKLAKPDLSTSLDSEHATGLSAMHLKAVKAVKTINSNVGLVDSEFPDAEKLSQFRRRKQRELHRPANKTNSNSVRTSYKSLKTANASTSQNHIVRNIEELHAIQSIRQGGFVADAVTHIAPIPNREPAIKNALQLQMNNVDLKPAAMDTSVSPDMHGAQREGSAPNTGDSTTVLTSTDTLIEKNSQTRSSLHKSQMYQHIGLPPHFDVKNYNKLSKICIAKPVSK